MAGIFENLKRMFAKPEQAIRGIQGQEEPFQRPDISERELEYKQALDTGNQRLPSSVQALTNRANAAQQQLDAQRQQEMMQREAIKRKLLEEYGDM